MINQQQQQSSYYNYPSVNTDTNYPPRQTQYNNW